MPKNMRKRRTIAGLLIMVLIMTAFSACTKEETAKEILEKSVERSMEIKTSKQNFKMDISYDPGFTEEEIAGDPMTAGLIEMIDSMNISGEFASDVEAGSSSGNMLLDMKGMQFKLDVYVSSMGSVALKMPMSEKYITVNSLGELPNDEEMEEMRNFSQEIASSLIGSFSEENMAMESKSVELEDGKYELKEITVTLDDSEGKALIKDLIPKIYANETMRKSMEDNLKLQAEMEGKSADGMDIDAEIDKMIEEAVSAFDEAEGVLAIDEFKMVFGIDGDYNTRTTDMSMAYSVADETIDKTVGMGFAIESEVYGIDEPVEIEMPDLNDENSITLEEFMMQMMLGGTIPSQPLPEPGTIQN
ncbi:MAG TPA: hypothetical protein VJ990_10610 [Clostridia bacterium]|nr:hypothetical protein [Clostridia bacterium]